MRHWHQSSALQPLADTPRRLHLQGVLQLQARRAGWLRAAGGRVWVTRGGDVVDHVLADGQAMALGRGQAVVVEPWRTGGSACLHWAAGAAVPVVDQPVVFLARAPRPASPRGVAWRALARGLRALAGRLAAAARSAEAMASRAQGSISAGDSMASSGALQ